MTQEQAFLFFEVSATAVFILLIISFLIHQQLQKARHVARLNHQFFFLFNRRTQKLSSPFRIFRQCPKLEGQKVRTLDQLLQCFKATERAGIELAFKTNLALDQQKVHLTATDINGQRSYRIEIQPADHKNEKLIVHISDITQLENEKIALRLECKMLNSSHALLKETLEHLPLPVWVRRNHELLYANKAYTAITGETVLAQTDYHHTKEQPWHYLRRGCQPKAFIIGGKRHLFSFHEKPLSQEHQLGFGLDETAQEAQSRNLKSYLKSYQNVMDTLSAAIAIYDQDAKLQYYNQAYLLMFSFEESFLSTAPHVGEVLDNLKRRRLLCEEADYSRYRQNQIELIKTITRSQETIMYLPDGRTIRSIFAPHAAGGSFYIFEDVSDKIKLMSQYKTLLEVYSATLDNLYEGVAVFGSDNRLKISNSSFAKLWNVPQETLQPGRHLSDLAEEVKSYFSASEGWDYYKLKVINRVTDRRAKKRRIERNDGSVLQFSYTPLPDGSNLTSYIDVTERDRIKQVLEDRSQALQKATKIKAKFLCDISEQLRPPLMTINGYAEMLAQTCQQELSPADLKEKVKPMQLSARLMISQIAHILDLGMLEAGEKTPRKSLENLWDLLAEVIEDLREDLHYQNATIDFNKVENEFLFWADATLFKAALTETLRAIFRNINDGFSLSFTHQVENRNATLSFTLDGLEPEFQQILNQKLHALLTFELAKKAFLQHATTLSLESSNPKMTKLVVCVKTISTSATICENSSNINQSPTTTLADAQQDNDIPKSPPTHAAATSMDPAA